MVLPNFLTIGAPKAGTSAIYYYLKQHPQIYMSPVKEPHFFALENHSLNFQGPGDKDRFRDAVTQLEEYEKLFANVSREVAIGEASTTYLSSETAPLRIKHYIPDVKLIAILRNPVDAAYASFLHLVRDGDEPLADFGLALEAEEKRVRQNWEGIWHYQRRGFYAEQLERYFQHFDRDRLKVYRYDDFKANPNVVLRDIFEFLEVDPGFMPDMSAKYNVSAMPKNPLLNKMMVKPNPLKSAINMALPKTMRSAIATRLKHWNFQDKKPPLSPELRDRLHQNYREDMLKLQDLIQQDLSEWLEPV